MSKGISRKKFHIKRIKSVDELYTKKISKDAGFVDLDNPPTNHQLNNMIRAYHHWPSVWTKYQGKVVKLLPEGKVQIEGKNPVSFKDFKNGHPDFPLNF